MTKRKTPSATETCTAFTDSGAPCRARRLPGRETCLFHDPERAAQLQRARYLGGKHRRRTAAPSPGRINLRTIDAAFDALELAFANVLRLDHGVARARLLTQVALAAVELIETADQERRLAELENERRAA